MLGSFRRDKTPRLVTGNLGLFLVSCFTLTVVLVASCRAQAPVPGSAPAPVEPIVRITNGPAVYHTLITVTTNISPNPRYNPSNRLTEAELRKRSPNLNPLALDLYKKTQQSHLTNYSPVTNLVFEGFRKESLSHLVWTNFIASTNGRTMQIWSVRRHPESWPSTPPVVAWNTNSLLWGLKGFTALSPCWENEGGPGQVPITALTRRHGYTRGHGMGPDGFRALLAGKKVWFCAADNKLVEVRIRREVVRVTGKGTNDYTLVLFDRDLPAGVTPVRVAPWKLAVTKHPFSPDAPWIFYATEQTGYVNAGVPGFTVAVNKGGDSGAPNLLPLPGELVFFSGRTTSGPSPQMQADMDELCRLEGLPAAKYQLAWADLSRFPDY
jgi:hypothetical protein